MAKFNFATKDERDSAIARALHLKPNVDGVYVTRHGYAIDTKHGPEILVSFHNLDALLAETETSAKEIAPEVTIVAEAAPVDAVDQANTEDASAEDDTDEVQAVSETKEERRARRAAEKAAKAAE